MAHTVSVLTPSRERVEMLKTSLESLGDVYEHLVYVDDDDPQLKEYEKLEIPNMQMVIGERYNYQRLQEYYNQLAEMATGDWLLIWNDDTIMHTEHWTHWIQEFDSNEPLVLNIHYDNNNYFPLISRAFYDALGHISLSPNSDSWVKEIAVKLGMHRNCFEHIYTEHTRDNIDDKTARNSKHIAPIMGGVHADMRHKEMLDDIKKLKEM